MHLLFLNYEFPPVGGGAAYASLATARELVSMGHGVDFLTTATPNAASDGEIDGVRVFRVRTYRRGIHEIGLGGALSFVCCATSRLRAIARRTHYDACHYYFGLPTGLLTRLPGPHQSYPYVISLRGSDVPGYDPSLEWHHRLMLPVTRRIWRGAHRVVANSHYLRRLALASAPDIAIEVIHNGAAAPDTSPVHQEMRSGVRVLAVSRLIARKGLDMLIRALGSSRSEDLSIDIAGDGPDGAALRQLATDCGVADRVRFHGFVDRPGLSYLYARADIFVLTSIAESCSMALLEAMAAGLPIVATKAGGNTELVQNGSNGLLIEPGNVDELSGALRTLAQDRAQRQRFAAANCTLAQERFSWRGVAQRYEAIFQEAVQASTRLRAGAEAGQPGPHPDLIDR